MASRAGSRDMPTGQQRRDWFRIEAHASAAPTGDEGASGASADVYIYDEIGDSWWGGVSAKQFAQDLEALNVDTIRLFLNSPGGDAWDGVAIMNTLRRHKARVEVTVDGLAASAASVIAMAGDHITMNRGSELMVHDAWGVAVGNENDMRQTADALGRLSNSLADTYSARAGGTRDDWRARMQAETWYTAEEAVLAGLADEWVDAPAAAASAAVATALLASADRGGLAARFQYRGRAQAPKPPVESPELPATTNNSNRKEDVVANDNNLAAGLRERFGLTADATDEQLLAKVDESLVKDQTPKVPEGTVLLDAAALADLKADAAAGREARAEQDRVRRDGIADRAVAEGRISPASRAKWVEQLAKDESGTSDLLDSLAKNTIPVVEIGHSDDTSPKSEVARVAAMAWGESVNDQNQEG